MTTNGLKGQIVKITLGNQGLTVLCQSIGWVEIKRAGYRSISTLLTPAYFFLQLLQRIHQSGQPIEPDLPESFGSENSPSILSMLASGPLTPSPSYGFLRSTL
jgi:hypothetical protein